MTNTNEDLSQEDAQLLIDNVMKEPSKWHFGDIRGCPYAWRTLLEDYGTEVTCWIDKRLTRQMKYKRFGLFSYEKTVPALDTYEVTLKVGSECAKEPKSRQSRLIYSPLLTTILECERHCTKRKETCATELARIKALSALKDS
jgi:hypothetical protein